MWLRILGVIIAKNPFQKLLQKRQTGEGTFLKSLKTSFGDDSSHYLHSVIVYHLPVLWSRPFRRFSNAVR